MKQQTFAHLHRRLTAGVVLLAYAAGCTHMPSGQKAFDNFEQCIAANLGIAAAGGVAVGALGKALARQVTRDKSTQNAVGVTAGVAAAVMIGMTAWRKCAAVYNTSEPIAQPASAPPPVAAQRPTPGLNLDRLEVRVEGTENDPPVPEFDFTYIAEDATAKDIKARFRHKVEIVRFKADDDDKLVLADAKGETLRDGSGRPIPLETAMRMPRDRLHWVTIADEGKDDYVEDVVIQQGLRAGYRHKLQIPPRAQLPLPLPVPMRYTVTVEAGSFKSARTVDFALLGTGERPKRFAAAVAAGDGDRARTATPSASVPAAPAAKTEPPKTAPAAAANGRASRAPAVTAPASAPAAPAARAETPKAAPAAANGGASRAPAVAAPASVPVAPAPRVEENKAAPAAAANFVATHTLRRDTFIHDAASSTRKAIGRLNRDTRVRIEEPAGFDVTNRPRVWVRIVTGAGVGGWLQAGELEEIR